MMRNHWRELGPSLVVGVGIILSTLLAVLTDESAWFVLAGPLLLAVTAVSADAWASRLRGESSGPSWTSLLLGGSFLLASAIVAFRDPGLVKTLLPIIGAGAWVPLLQRSGGRHRTCRGI